jgi:radical SAM superfamily enzyme YgiQ (UPF0313 family)
MNEEYIIPDHSILKNEYYLVDTSIELSRGCPHRCKFCSDPIVYGNKYRIRDLDQVLTQIEQIKSDYIYFADDNIIGKPRFAKEMFKELRKLNKRWFGAASTILSNDTELMDLVIESGCKYLVVGFESSSNEILVQLRKKHNIGKDYGSFVKYMQSNGVIIDGCFILGFENESVQSIIDQNKYARDLGVLLYNPAVLTPYPGTPYFNEFKEEGRLLHEDWSKYYVKGGVPVFHSENHTPGYLRKLKSAVTANTVTYFLRQLRKQESGFIQKFVE